MSFVKLPVNTWLNIASIWSNVMSGLRSAILPTDRTSRLTRLALWLPLVALMGGFQLSGQVAAPTIPDNGPTASSPLGLPPQSSAAGAYESVSPMNGSLNLYIPLLSLSQRGGYSMSLGLVHHSNLHSLVQRTTVGSTTSTTSGIAVVVDEIAYSDSMVTSDYPLENNLPRLQFSYEYVGDHGVVTGGATDTVDNIFCATNFAFTDWSGSKHPFENVSTCNWHLGGPNAPMVNLTDSSDGSFYRLDSSTQTDLKVYSKDGTVYHFYGFSNIFPDSATSIASFANQENYYDMRAGLIVDPNGNRIAIASSSAGYTVTDTLGRTIGITPAAISYSDSNGQPQTIQIATTKSSATINHDFGLSCHYTGAIQNPPQITPTVSVLSGFTGISESSTTTITLPSVVRHK